LLITHAENVGLTTDSSHVGLLESDSG